MPKHDIVFLIVEIVRKAKGIVLWFYKITLLIRAECARFYIVKAQVADSVKAGDDILVYGESGTVEGPAEAVDIKRAVRIQRIQKCTVVKASFKGVKELIYILSPLWCRILRSFFRLN